MPFKIIYLSVFFLVVFLVHSPCISVLKTLSEQSHNHLKILSTLKSENGSFIVAMTDEGRQQIPITKGPNDWMADWLGIKNTILFLSDRNVSKQVSPKEGDPFYQPKSHLYIQEIGGLPLQLTFGDHKVWLPRPSPDGKFIAFLSDQDEWFGELYIIEVETGKAERITTGKRWPMEPAVWLSSTRLFFNMFIDDTLEIFSFDLKSKQLYQLTHSIPRTKNGYVSICPNQSHIAFVSRDRDSDNAAGIINPQIFIMDINGENRRRLTHDSCINFMPMWSPNGEQIIFLQEQTIEGKTAPRLRIINKDGTNEHQLNDDCVLSDLKWLPSRSLIIYTSQSNEWKEIRGFDLATQQTYTISQDPTDYSESAVRPTLMPK